MSISQAKIENLERRGQLLQRLRKFFNDRKFIEVETPLLSEEVIPEQHIQPPRLGKHYLQASPELHMKQLVAAGMSAIYQVTKSFRADEHGPLHNPEFTIIEWYRTGDNMHAGMLLLNELCQTVADAPAAKRTSYAKAFLKYVGVCPHTAPIDELMQCVHDLKIDVAKDFARDERDEWLNLLLSFRVEPNLGCETPEILFDYPASQAALARVECNETGIDVAKRFELYWHGVELANGYDELTDSEELRRRLETVNAARRENQQPTLPLPESLLAAMQDGLPECSGCALGFDRLVMVALGEKSIAAVSA